MRKNYFAKKFVAYSMAFAVAFSTLTVSPVFVREAKAAEISVEQKVALEKYDDTEKKNVADLFVDAAKLVDGDIWVDDANITSDNTNFKSITQAQVLAGIKEATGDTDLTVAGLKGTIINPTADKVTKAYTKSVMNDTTGYVTTDTTKADVVTATQSYQLGDGKTVEEDAIAYIADAKNLNQGLNAGDATNNTLWFKVVPHTATFGIPSETTTGQKYTANVTVKYYKVLSQTNKNETTGNLNLGDITENSYGLYVGTNAAGVAEKLYNVCQRSNFTAVESKKDTYAVAGEKVKLAVDTYPTDDTAPMGEVKYSWEKDGKSITCDKAVLELDNITASDFGTYKATVTDGMQTAKLSFNLYKMTEAKISGIVNTVSSTLKVLDSTGAHGKLPSGKVTLTSSLPSGAYHYIWLYGGNEVTLPSANKTTYNSLNKSITVENKVDVADKYICYAVPSSIYDNTKAVTEKLDEYNNATNDVDKADKLNALLTEEKALVTGGDSKEVYTEEFTLERVADDFTLESEVKTVKMGDTVTLTAPDVDDEYTYLWTFRNRTTSETLNTKTIVINTVDQTDLGTITCEVTTKEAYCHCTGDGTPHASQTVCDDATKPNTSKWTTDKYTKNFNLVCESDLQASSNGASAKVGQKDVELKVNVTSTLPVSYTWYEATRDENDFNETGFTNTNTDPSVLKITKVTDGMLYIGDKKGSFQYVCVVSDGINSIKVPVRINGIETFKVFEEENDIASQKVTDGEVNYSTLKNSSVTLAPIVVAASEDIEKQLTYTWTKDGIAYSTDKSVTVNVTDAASYKVVITEGTQKVEVVYNIDIIKEDDLKAITNINAFTVDVERNVIYTGKEINPINKVICNVGGGIYTLVLGTDYDVTLIDAVNAGISLYKVVLKGNFADVYNNAKEKDKDEQRLNGTFYITRAENEVEIADTTVALGTSVQPKTVKNLGKSALTYTYYADADCTTEIEVPTKVGTYYVKATAEVSNNYTAATSNVAKVTVAPGTTKIGNTSRTASSITLNWSKVTGATKYRVFIKTSTGWKTLGYTDKLSFTKKDLASATTYTFAVKAYAGSVASSKYVSRTTTTAPAKVSTLAVKAKGSRKVAISYSKVTRATGYQVYMAKGNGSYKKVAQGKLTAITKSKLTKGATYKFKVRAYKTVGDNTYYGAFSSAKSVKVK